MVEQEEQRPRVEVFKRSAPVMVREEEGWGNDVTGIYPAVRVGVLKDGEVVWEKRVTTIFVGARTGFLLTISKPFYARRIAGSERKAEKIASKLR